MFNSISFEKRVFFSVAIPLLGAILLGFNYFLYDKVKTIDENLKKDGLKQAQYIANLSEYDLTSGDKKNLLYLLQKFAKSTEELYSITIYDKDSLPYVGPIFSSEKKKDISPINIDLLEFKQPIEVALYPFTTYDLNEDINFDRKSEAKAFIGPIQKEIAGFVDLRLSKTKSIKYRNRIVAWSLTLMVIALLMGYWLAKILSRTIVDPLNNIIRAIVLIRDGDYSSRIHYSGKDELGRLSENTNQLAEFLENAQQRIHIQFEELTETRKQAMQASEAKSEFMASMSHELRQPLTAIIGFLPSLKRINRDDYAEEILNILETQANKLCRRIDEILNFEKMEAGKLNLINSYFSIEKEIQNTVTVYNQEASSKNIKLSYMLDSNKALENVEIFTDRIHLQTIVDNLVGNAIKFTDFGSVHIYVLLRYINEEKLEFNLEVRDTGIGIPDDKLETIFEPFDQADRSSARRHEGVGLGLHITKKIVDYLGGSINVESQIYKGSTFKVSLPFLYRFQSEQHIPSVAQSNNEHPVITKRVLYIEDNPSSQTVVKYLLKQIDVSTDIADSGNEGLTLFRKNNYKVVFLDLHMPGMDGFSLAQEIRHHEKINSRNSKQTVLIALTADTTDEAAEKCYHAGFNNILYKPFKEIDLFNAVRGVLSVENKLNQLINE